MARTKTAEQIAAARIPVAKIVKRLQNDKDNKFLGTFASMLSPAEQEMMRKALRNKLAHRGTDDRNPTDEGNEKGSNDLEERTIDFRLS